MSIINISEFFDAKDVNPLPKVMTWESLISRLSTFDVRQVKDGVAWSPTLYHTPQRGNKNVHSITACVLDLDHLTAKETRNVKSAMEKAGYNAIMHSTFSHVPPQDNCYRLVIQLEEPVKQENWATVRQAIIDSLHLPCDPATKDVARLYYWPATPNEKRQDVQVFTGKPLNVTEVLREKDRAVLPETTQVHDIQSIKKHLASVSNPISKSLIKSVLNGEPLAAPGERDATMFKLASTLVFKCPTVPLDVLVEIARPSIAAMQSDNPIEDELNKFREKLERVQVNYEVTKKEERKLRDGLVKANIMDATGGETDEPYSPEELEAMARNANCSAAAFMRRLIIQCGNAYFVFSNGRYLSPISQQELAISLPRDLSQAPVEWYRQTEKGPKKKTVSEILEAHCTVAREIKADLTIQQSYYEAKTQAFHEAACPLRPWTPVEHKDVHEWLMKLGGLESHKLLDWLASVTRLDRQSAALFLEGDAGAGKGLLASGLAHLWHDGGPTPFKSLISGFNSQVAKCPLVFADEGFPKRRDYSVNDELRQWLGSSELLLSRKYMPDATLKGSIRLLMASNNNRILDSIEELSEDDRQALAVRLLYIKVDKKARQFLESMPIDARQEFADSKIPEYVMWLRENREVVPGSRFIVEGNDSALHARLMVSNGVAGAVCEFLAKQILTATPTMKSQLSDKLRWGNDEIWVAASLFQDKSQWEILVPGTFFPSSAALYRALSNLKHRKVRIDNAPGKRGPKSHFSVIRSDLLKTWTAENSDLDVEALMGEINKLNEDMR